MPCQLRRIATVLAGTWLIALAGCDQIQTAASRAGGERLPTASIRGDSPRAFIDRAIEICGGERNIARLQIGRVEMVGRGGFAPGVNGQFTIVDTFHLPRRLRRETSFNDGKIVLRMLTIVDGDRGWTKAYGEGAARAEVRELQPESDNNNAFPHSVLGSLLEMRNPAVTLKRLASDQPGQTWIAVERDGQPLGTNVFDNRTGHFLSSNKQLVDAAAGPVAIRTIYSDYRNVSGIDVPMQMTSYRDNDQIMELKVVKLDILSSVDPQLFARPD